MGDEYEITWGQTKFFKDYKRDVKINDTLKGYLCIWGVGRTSSTHKTLKVAKMLPRAISVLYFP